MKTRLVALLLVAACAPRTAPGDGPAEAALEPVEAAAVDVADAPPPPLRYTAPRLASEVTCDGVIDEPAWEAAPWTPLFVDIEGDVKPRPRFETRMKLAWDDTHLYVAAELEEPHVWGTLTKHDSIIYRDNDFEVFIDPEGDELWYGEVEINALGTVFDLMLDKAYRKGGKAIFGWTPDDLRTGVHVDGTLNDPSDVDAGWSVEIALPFDSLTEHAGVPVPPREGDTWRLNASRVQWRHDVVDGAYVKRPKTPEDNWVWTPQHAINMHIPEHWGFVSFGP